MYPMITFTAPVRIFEVNSFSAPWWYVDVPHHSLHHVVPVGKWKFIPVQVTIQDLTWNTSLMPKGKGKLFIALKKSVRNKLALQLGEIINVQYQIL